MNVKFSDFMRALKEVRSTVTKIEIEQFERYAGIAKEEDTEERIPREKSYTGNVAQCDDDPERAVLESGEENNLSYKFEWDNLPSVKFNDVAGLQEVKETVRIKVLLPLCQPQAFEGYEKKSGTVRSSGNG